MGNTIRRQPITHGIPAAPNYKFLNITDFAGLNISDNPFVVKSNTASDVLNVYVDEDNALTTRPRLEKRIDILSTINKPNATITDVVNTSRGYLVYGVDNEIPFMYIIKNNDITTISPKSNVNLPTEKMIVYEKNNSIYLLGAGQFLFLRNNTNVLLDVRDSSYNPIIRTVNATLNDEIKGYEVEKLNLFSNKYKEAYFWNGINKIEDIYDLTTITYGNKYMTSNETELDSNKLIRKYIPNYNTHTDNTEAFLTTGYSGNIPVASIAEVGLNEANYYLFTNPSSADLPTYRSNLFLDGNEDASIVAYCYCANSTDVQSGQQTLGGVFVYRDGAVSKVLVNSTDIFRTNDDDNNARIRISNDGKHILTYTESNVIFFTYENNTYNATRLTFDNTTYRCCGCGLSSDGSIGIVKLQKKTEAGTTFHRLGLIKNGILSLLNDADEEIIGADISVDGKLVAAGISNNTIRLYDKVDEEAYTTKDVTNNKISLDRIFSISQDLDKIYTGQGYFVISNDWFFNYDIYRTYNRYFDGYIPVTSTNKCYFYNKYYYDFTFNREYPSKMTIVKFNYSSSEPLLELTKELIKNDPSYIDWEKRRNILLNAELTIEFDTNRWFAVGNRIYHTSDKEQIYIDIDDYIDLGDDDPITGFNLANDNLLIVYKQNRLYLITYNEVSGLAGYTYQETKNTVGNEAFGASIVPTLTEKPIQINRDGIYALNQLKNVQSSDRISVLISDGINAKWLKESEELIYNSITINRLYWTYIILRDRDKKMSKVYLLDNRNAAWYYWEFPIYISKAFVEDNKTHFVDEVGNIYSLEKTDSINKLNPEETEYFDEGKKLINWYWQSQILPLGTINYSKRLVNTTFIVTDTDESDRYGLNYSFKIYRKLVSESNSTTISNNLNYVQSVTKKTMIPRFNFLQIKLSNIDENADGAFDNNKFRLVGLGLKYVLLEGLY